MKRWKYIPTYPTNIIIPFIVTDKELRKVMIVITICYTFSFIELSFYVYFSKKYRSNYDALDEFLNEKVEV